MNRKDFIASIPMLASIPFIGKELIREKNKIILLDPHPLEIVKEIPQAQEFIDPLKLRLVLMYDGVAFAEAYHHEYSEQGGRFDNYLDFNNGSLPSRVQIIASFRDSEKLIEAFYQSRGFRR